MNGADKYCKKKKDSERTKRALSKYAVVFSNWKKTRDACVIIAIDDRIRNVRVPNLIVRVSKSYGNRTRDKIVGMKKKNAYKNRTEIVSVTKSYDIIFCCKK